MKCDIKIYGTTKRKNQILKNKEILQLSDEDIFMIEPDGKWVYELAKKAWTTPWQQDVTHRLVLQDDAELCPNFEKYLQQAIEAQPDKMIFLTALSYNKESTYANNLTTPYVYQGSLIQGCAIIMPTKIINDCFSWAELRWPEDIFTPKMHEDIAFILFANSINMPVIQVVPSLTQHIGDTSCLFGWTRPSRTFYFDNWEKADYTSTTVAHYKP